MSARYCILIVEDNEAHAETLKRTIERLLPGVVVLKCTGGFERALDEIHPHRPDVYIVDLYEGEYVPETLRGPELCKQIWSKRFRPLIIHSALDADPHIDERLTRHPFYKYISKAGADCADQVAAQVKGFLVHAAAVRQVEDEVHAVLQIVIQDTAGAIWSIEIQAETRREVLIRSARRRVGAMMDLKPMLSGDTLLAWEQYIVPPLEADLLMADVLRLKGGSPDDAAAYRVVLTPSCDLVRYKGKAKVRAMLAGKCVDAKCFFGAIGLRKAEGADVLKKRLAMILTQPQVNGYCPLPAYPHRWPNMAIKLRDTEFVDFEEVFSTECERQFERVASIDSPFREQIAWAHMQVASRPALPDRELDAWIEGILAAMDIK